MFLNKQQQTAPKLEREVAMPGQAADEALAATREHKRKVALFVAHGMGQQVPFETMDCVAAGLIRIAKKDGRPAAASTACATPGRTSSAGCSAARSTSASGRAPAFSSRSRSSPWSP